MKAKRLMALLMAIVLMLALVACGSNEGGEEETEEDGTDYTKLTMDELYALAKEEGGVVEVYSTTADAQAAAKKFKKAYPDIEVEYISCDTNTVSSKIEMECDTGNINADVLCVKDASGEIYNELVAYDYLDIYYPESVCSHIDESLLKYGLPLYAAFNPWYYNTDMFPDGVPLESWWDIVKGYNVDTGSYTDASGNDTQYWSIYTKDITGPSYASLWAQLIVDSDMLEQTYEEQYGEELVYTYTDKLQNAEGIMEFPENNAGVELFYRFSQMKMTELDDGDAVVEAVDLSINGPSLGLTSASKIDVAANSAWVIGIEPYTAFQACNYLYAVEGCDNPAAARLFILFCLGGDDGQSGCYTAFDKQGAWSVRDDVEFTKTGITAEEVGLTTPDFDKVYETYPNVTAYWTYWRSLAPSTN